MTKVWAAAGVGANPGSTVITIKPKPTAALAKKHRLSDPHGTIVPEPKFPSPAIIFCPPPSIKKYGNIVHQKSAPSNR
jgi:hypothetical protein